MRPIHIEAGQWVLVHDEFCVPESRCIREIVEELAYPDDSDGFSHVSYRLHVEQIEHVMPKTFRTRSRFGTKRHYRDLVIAVAGSKGEILALRDKLVSVGIEAEAKIEQERKRLLAAFEAETRKAAVEKIHRSLPHIFGRETSPSARATRQGEAA